MTEVIGLRFKNGGKTYYFDPKSIKFEKGESAIVETAQGVEMGEIVIENKMLPEADIVATLKPVLRRATEADYEKAKQIAIKEQEALVICAEKIKEHGLNMNLVNAEYTFDCSKILFYFTADGRIDFRELVKTLATTFRSRIELRQIGVRDEAKLLGGIGICGKVLCCKSFLSDFHPVSIKMAKEQSLSLNPTKISGCCGRLMCCLKYEQDMYEELLKRIPKVDAIVKGEDGKGVVVDCNVLAGTIKVRHQENDTVSYKVYKATDVEVIRDAQVKLTKEEIRALKGLEKE